MVFVSITKRRWLQNLNVKLGTGGGRSARGEVVVQE